MSKPSPLELAQMLRPVLARLELQWARRSSSTGLSRAQLALLSLLAGEGPLRINELAKLESIRMPTASNAVHQLEKLGLVERHQDVADRRGVVVALTPYGKELLAEVTETRDRQFAELFEGLSDEDLDIAVSAIPVIRAMLDNYAGVLAREAESSQE